MPSRHRITFLTRLLAVAAAAVLATSVLGTDVADAGAPSRQGSLTGAPAKGSCYNATTAEGAAQSLTKAPVGCRTRHTLQTIKVGVLPKGVAYGTTDRFYKAVSNICNPAYLKVANKDLLKRYRSLYTYYFFRPTKDDVADGARWISCHMALAGSTKLLPLPAGLPRVTSRAANSVARCLTSGLKYTTCNTPHKYHATSSYYLKVHGTPKQVDKQYRASAKKVCARRLHSQNFAYSFVHASDTKIAINCYKKTPR